MTQKEKAGAYDKAIENMRKFRDALNNHEETDLWALKKEIVTDIEYYFPELKGSEENRDEKIREMLIEFFGKGAENNGYTNGISDKDIITWLEKQGEQKPVNDTDENIVEAVKDTSILDMVEPKFHEGEWILLDKPCQIESMSKDGNYIVKYSDDDETSTRSKKFCETYFHLWTIQDAKNGDVLYSKKHNLLWIYKNAEQCHSCVNLNYSSNISIGADIVIPNDTCPATKEQRDTLLKAMDNAGYSFDFETKKLKKIEKEIEIPFGAKDSELQEVTYSIPKGFHAEIKGASVVIVKGEQKPVEWSEEDEGMLNSFLHKLEVCDLLSNKEIRWIKGKLKSLRPQKSWKPSSEQIDALEHFVRNISESGYASPYDNNTKLLYSLLEQLKKLREE